LDFEEKAKKIKKFKQKLSIIQPNHHKKPKKKKQRKEMKKKKNPTKMPTKREKRKRNELHDMIVW
jgi:hypothetical protein